MEQTTVFVTRLVELSLVVLGKAVPSGLTTPSGEPTGQKRDKLMTTSKKIRSPNSKGRRKTPQPLLKSSSRQRPMTSLSQLGPHTLEPSRAAPTRTQGERRACKEFCYPRACPRASDLCWQPWKTGWAPMGKHNGQGVGGNGGTGAAVF